MLFYLVREESYSLFWIFPSDVPDAPFKTLGPYSDLYGRPYRIENDLAVKTYPQPGEVKKLQILQTYQGDTLKELYRGPGTFSEVHSYGQGWLAPNGTYYGFHELGGHDFIAHVLFDKNPEALTDLGYIHIPFDQPYVGLLDKTKITPDQMVWLEKNCPDDPEWIKMKQEIRSFWQSQIEEGTLSKEATRFVHYIDKESLPLVKKYGLTSLEYMLSVPELRSLAIQFLQKYKYLKYVPNLGTAKKEDFIAARKKFVDSPTDTSPEEILGLLKQLRGDNGAKMIYALRHEIPPKLNDKLDNFAANKVAVSFDLDELEQAGLLSEVYLDGKTKEWFDQQTPEQYYGQEIPDKILFMNVPHPAIAPHQGRIPPEYLQFPKEDKDTLASKRLSVLLSLVKIANKKDKQMETEFTKVKDSIKANFGFDVTYLKMIISDKLYYSNGKENTEMDPLLSAGNWMKNHTIRIATKEHILKVINRYQVSDLGYDKFIKIIIGHECSHEIWKNILSESERRKWTAKLLDFETAYTKTNDTPEERFCEYIGHNI